MLTLLGISCQLYLYLSKRSTNITALETRAKYVLNSLKNTNFVFCWYILRYNAHCYKRYIYSIYSL